MEKTRFRAKDRPACKCGDREHQHDWNEIACNRVGEALDRGAAALRLLHQSDNLRQNGITAYALCLHCKRAALIEGRARYGVPVFLLDGQTFAREHTLVHPRRAGNHYAVHRNLFARSHPQNITHPDFGKRNIKVFRAPNYPRRFWLKSNEFFNRCARAPFCPRFQQTAQQQQRDNHGGSFVIYAAAHAPRHEEVRRNGHGKRVNVG